MKRRIIWMTALSAGVGTGCDQAQEPAPRGTPDPYHSTSTVQAALEDPRICGGEYGWSELIATAAEVAPSPSDSKPDDTRAGSMELNLGGSQGFGDKGLDPAYRAGIVTLRNGAGVPLDQVQLDRVNVPKGLDGGCRNVDRQVQCWRRVPEDLTASSLVAAVPFVAADSNADFDASGQRVTVSGGVQVDYSMPAGPNASTFHVRWDAPKGIETARMALRAQFDADANGDLSNDPLVSLVRMRWTGSGPDLLAPGVRIVDKTATAFEVAGNLADVLAYVCDNAVDDVCTAQAGSATTSSNQAIVTLENPGADAVAIHGIWVRWPAAAGRLRSIKLGASTLYSGAMQPDAQFLDGATLGAATGRTIEAGASKQLRLAFDKALPTSGATPDIFVVFQDGCTATPK